MGLAPTSSTTAVLCYGDALAVVASKIYEFNNADFGKFHPSGTLGKRLILKVKDLMSVGENNAIVEQDTLLEDAVVQLSKKGLGIVSVVDQLGNLVGVITDGDLRRQMEKKANIYKLHVKDVMSKNPVVVSKDILAVEALKILKDCNISSMPVCEDNKVIGTVRIQDIISVGIV